MPPDPHPGQQNSAANPDPPCELFAIELRTGRWADLVQWYRMALDLRVLVRIVEDEYALLAAGSSRVAIVGRKDLDPAPAHTSSRTLLVFEVENLEAAITRLQATGTTASQPQQHGEGFWETTAIDPDGNRLRLFQWPKK